MSKDKYKKHANNLFRVIKWVDAEGNVYETEQFNGKPDISTVIRDEHGGTINLLSGILKQLKKMNMQLATLTDEEIDNHEVE